MSKYKIIEFPAPILRRKSKIVSNFDSDLHDLIVAMGRVMKRQKHGIGIAAPQIGVSLRVAIVDVSARVKGAHKLVLINPVIESMSCRIPSREGCMSVPEYMGQIVRYDKIKVSWQDEDGVSHAKRSSGIEARCIQHEIDHLNGVLFLDHVSSMKRDMIPRSRKS